MSKANIVKTETLPNGKRHVTFETDTHHFTYEYTKRQQKSLDRGADPSDLSGHLVKKEKIRR